MRRDQLFGIIGIVIAVGLLAACMIIIALAAKNIGI